VLWVDTGCFEARPGVLWDATSCRNAAPHSLDSLLTFAGAGRDSQAQQSMNLVELSYVRFETGASSFTQPAYLVLDLHFFNYPSELAPTLVRGTMPHTFAAYVYNYPSAWATIVLEGLVGRVARAGPPPNPYSSPIASNKPLYAALDRQMYR
jgi:hypothetical protein